jgi:alkanesulfonate monooxygenase SsuD/methylene tetrahydromethanopterin reductase-like flavin-dependent oxidoreductase (luciferase family)
VPPLAVGTIASPELLAAAHPQRQQLIGRILDSGLDHVFTADHVSFHNGNGMDGLINAATLCALHPDLKVVVGVYLLALRHPIAVARQLATLASNAPGQLILGIGVGGEDRNEIAMCGVDPATRGRRTDECLHIVQALLAGETLDFDGRFFQFERARIRPQPDVPVPFLIGGRSDHALARTARYGDGWLASWCSPRRFAEAVAVIDDHCSRAGRTAPKRHGLQIWVGIDEDRAVARDRLAQGLEAFYRIPFERFEKYSPYGTPEQIAESLAEFRDVGCRLFNLMPVAASEAAGIDGIAEVKRLLDN